MNRQDVEKWMSISAAVRAAFITGNFSWARGFEQAYKNTSGQELTVETFKKGPFAVEPVTAPKGRTAVHMLLFFENGYICEGKLTDETGRVALMWLHSDDWRNRPIVSLPTNMVTRMKKSGEHSHSHSNAQPKASPHAQTRDSKINAGLASEEKASEEKASEANEE